MQEVWRGRLPRLGVVNSIGRKKFGGCRVCLMGDNSKSAFLKIIAIFVCFPT